MLQSFDTNQSIPAILSALFVYLVSCYLLMDCDHCLLHGLLVIFPGVKMQNAVQLLISSNSTSCEVRDRFRADDLVVEFSS